MGCLIAIWQFIAEEAPPVSLFAWEKITLVGFLLGLVWMIVTRRLVPGSFYEELKRENEKLRAEVEALKIAGIQATTMAEVASVQKERHK